MHFIQEQGLSKEQGPQNFTRIHRPRHAEAQQVHQGDSWGKY